MKIGKTRTFQGLGHKDKDLTFKDNEKNKDWTCKDKDKNTDFEIGP